MPQPAHPLEALCSACGLCCDGALFTHVALAPGEAERLGAAVEVRPRKDGALALAQPCRALEPKSRCCAVYADRPRGCRDYVCSLYRALEGGEARPDEALGLVAAAHALLEQLAALSPPGGAGSPLASARRALRSDGGPGLSDAARAALTAAENHLRFHFGWKG